MLIWNGSLGDTFRLPLSCEAVSGQRIFVPVKPLCRFPFKINDSRSETVSLCFIKLVNPKLTDWISKESVLLCRRISEFWNFSSNQRVDGRKLISVVRWEPTPRKLERKALSFLFLFLSNYKQQSFKTRNKNKKKRSPEQRYGFKRGLFIPSTVDLPLK